MTETSITGDVEAQWRHLALRSAQAIMVCV